MFSVAQPYTVSSTNDAVFVVQANLLIKRGGVDVDIGCGAAFGGADAEEAPMTENDTSVIDVVDTYGLQEVSWAKKDFAAWVKPYLARVKGHLESSRPHRLEPFMKGAQQFVLEIIKDFDNWVFYINANMDNDGMICFARYRDGATVPEFYFFRDGLQLCFPGTGANLAAEAHVSAEIAAREGYVV